MTPYEIYTSILVILVAGIPTLYYAKKILKLYTDLRRTTSSLKEKLGGINKENNIGEEISNNCNYSFIYNIKDKINNILEKRIPPYWFGTLLVVTPVSLLLAFLITAIIVIINILSININAVLSIILLVGSILMIYLGFYIAVNKIKEYSSTYMREIDKLKEEINNAKKHIHIDEIKNENIENIRKIFDEDSYILGILNSVEKELDKRNKCEDSLNKVIEIIGSIQKEWEIHNIFMKK